MGEKSDTGAARAAHNEAVYREVNERVKELNEAFDALLPLGDWICECANEQCFERIQMTHEEYEAVRAHERCFFVKPDEAHLVPDIEAVVERHERYWVVEKIGVAGAVAEQHDPRSRAR